MFNKLGRRFVIVGVFNVKHTAWGARIITLVKGGKLVNVIFESNRDFHLGGKTT